MNIAIVDDDYRTIANLTYIIEKYYNKNEYKQDDFSNGMEFVNALKRNHYDIVFMDLEMELMDGEEASRRLRENDENEETYIIYVSSHKDNLISLFSFHPFDFVEKPIDESKITELLSKIENREEKIKKTISLVTDRKKTQIPIGNLMYAESKGHRVKIKISGQDQIVVCYMKIDDLQKQLEEISNRFYRIHTSFLVNRSYIKRYTNTSVFIDDLELPISRKYKEQITEKLLEEMLDTDEDK